jgi:DNA-binding SARP family transcriptional activator
MDRISIEAGSVIVDEQRFPGRQGRLVLAYLLAARGRPVSRDELADALWADVPPARWEKALSVLVSKLRMVLNEAGIDGSESLTSAFGCYKLTLPAGTWIDVVAADEAAAAAARALAAGDLDAALINASTAASLARRTFLPGEEGRWVDDRRAELREILVRALECVSDAKRLSGDPTWAVRAAEELVLLDPFRESGYRRLMEAQSAAGNDAEALRTYERCRTLLADELGAYPSSETEAVYLEILRSAPRGSAPEVDQPEADGPSTTPPLALDVRVRSGRRRTVLVAVPFLSLAVAAAAVALVRASGGTASIPPKLLPNSVVRIDPSTLEPTEVVRVAPDPDLVVLAGGYVWVTNLAFRYTSSAALRNSGHRTLTRVDPATGDAVTVGGGLAPCGLVPDPSGDVWVANCYPARSGVHADVQRVDARTLALKQTFPVRRRLLPRPRVRRWILVGRRRQRRRGLSRDHPDRSPDGSRTSDVTRQPRGLARLVGRVRRPVDERFRPRQRDANTHGERGPGDIPFRRRQSSQSRGRRRWRLGRRLGEPRGDSPSRRRIQHTA